MARRIRLSGRSATRKIAGTPIVGVRCYGMVGSNQDRCEPPQKFTGLETSRNQESVMDKDRVEGAAKEVKGSVKEGWGKVTGDKSTEVEGKVEKNVGKAQGEVGKAKDEVRDAVKR